MADQVPPLVTTSWLSQHLDTKMAPLVIIDATWNPRGKSGNEQHQEQHIPGSLYFNLDECKDKESPFKVTLPRRSEFEDYVSELGISNETHVVVYENDPRYKAKTSARVWWMFRYFGHDNVSVLDGGLEQWFKDGFPVTSDKTEDPVKAMFKANMQVQLRKTCDEVLEDMKEGSVQLVDTRPSHWFDGTKPSLWPGKKIFLEKTFLKILEIVKSYMFPRHKTIIASYKVHFVFLLMNFLRSQAWNHPWSQTHKF